MRSIEECKEEVFRRSEERIKNRKKVIVKRSLIVGIGAVASIMLTLCVIKWATTVRLSDRPSGDFVNDEYENEMMLPPGNDGNDGDANTGGTEGGIPLEDMTVVGSLSTPAIEFKAQYTSTYNHREEVIYPMVSVIRTLEELQDFCEANKEQNVSQTCEKYNEAYFENRILIVVTLSASSGEIEYTVGNLFETENEYIIKINTYKPEAMTCDMKEWNIFIEPQKGFGIEPEETIVKEFEVEFIR